MMTVLPRILPLAKAFPSMDLHPIFHPLLVVVAVGRILLLVGLPEAATALHQQLQVELETWSAGDSHPWPAGVQSV